MNNLDQIVQPLRKAFWEMNNLINAEGQLKKSRIIKQWHKYDNHDWDCILAVVRYLDEQGKIKLPQFILNDVELLSKHLEEFGVEIERDFYCDNLLYPSPKHTKTLPDRMTHGNPARNDKTIKTRVFRTMMNVREALCEACGIDLPNDDSSKGKLNPTPFDDLFN
jgi:hypothetical protein